MSDVSNSPHDFHFVQDHFNKYFQKAPGSNFTEKGFQKNYIT